MARLRKLLLALSALPAFAAAAGAQFIFYDYDNSRLSTANNFYSAGDITSGQYGRGKDVYATSGWLINTSNGAGMYNENLGVHFYATGGVWSIVGAGSLSLALRSNHEYYGPTTYGSIRSDGSSFGMLNSAGSWALYSTGGSQLVNFPGSIQIGPNGFGGIQDMDGYSSYGTFALDTTRGGYYGLVFGPNAGDMNMMFDGSGTGGYYREGSGWRDLSYKSSRDWYIYGTVNVDGTAYSDTYPALTKVVYRSYCNGGNNYCYPPGCPNGTTASATGCGVLGMTYTCYRDCCWGTD